MRRYRPDVFHCQSQRMHKFLSQHAMTASSLSRPETPDERRQFPVRVVNDASSFNFRCAASFGEETLSAIAVVVSFREFSRLIRRTISRLHFRRSCRRLSSSRPSGKPDVFSWKISECARFVERFVSSTDRFVIHTRFRSFTRSLVLNRRKLNDTCEWYIRI